MKKEFNEQLQVISLAGRLADVNEGLKKMKEAGTKPTEKVFSALKQLDIETMVFHLRLEGFKEDEGNKAK